MIAIYLEGTDYEESFKDLLPLQRNFFLNEEHLMCMIDLYKVYHEILQSITSIVLFLPYISMREKKF